MFSTLRLEMTKRIHAKTTTHSTSKAFNEAQKHKQEAAFNFPKSSPVNCSSLEVFRPRRKTEPPKLPMEIAHAALEPVPRWACDQIAEVSRLCEGNNEMALHEAYLRAIEKDPKCQLLELVKEIAYMVYCGSRSQVQPRETFSHHWDALLEQIEFPEASLPNSRSCNSKSRNSQSTFALPACGFSAEYLPQTSVETTNRNGPTKASTVRWPSPITYLPGPGLPLSGQNTAIASSIPFFEAPLAVSSASFAAKPAPLAPGFVARWRARFTHFTASVREDWTYRRLERRTARELKKQHKKLRKMEAERLLEEIVCRARAAAFEHIQGNLDRIVAEKKHLQQQQQVGHSQRAQFAAQAQRRVYAAWRHAERTRATEHKREGRNKKRDSKKKDVKKKELKKAPQKKTLEKASKNNLKKTPTKESSSSDSHKSTISPRSLRSTAATSRCLCHHLKAKN